MHQYLVERNSVVIQKRWKLRIFGLLHGSKGGKKGRFLLFLVIGLANCSQEYKWFGHDVVACIKIKLMVSEIRSDDELNSLSSIMG